MKNETEKFPPNPLMGADFEKLRSLDELERKLRAHWGTVPAAPGAWLGQILTSAVIHGGLVAPQAWSSWLERVRSRQFQTTTTPYIVFSLKDGEGRYRQRRWFADPLTTALLRGWKRSKLTADGQLPAPEVLIHNYCRAVEGDVGGEADSFMGWFLPAVVLRLRLQMPGVLADYAAGIEHSSAVAQPLWRNLLLAPTPELFVSQLDADSLLRFQIDLTPASARRGYRYYTGGSAHILKLLAPLSSAKAQNLMNRRSEALLVRSQVKRLLGTKTLSGLLDRPPRTIREAVYNLFGLLSYSGRRPGEVRLNRVRLSTQLSYLGALARYDWRECWMRRFKDAPPDLMHSIFDAVVSAAKTREAPAHSAVRKLDAYICHHWNHLKPWPGRDRQPDTSGGVAEILSGAQFSCALRLIDQLSVEPRHRLMIRLAAILMFRAGVRGREVRHFRIGDLDRHEGLVELTVRVNDDVTLKSLSSYRRLPLDILLQQEEQDELIAWHRRRLVEARGDTAKLLFPACPDCTGAEEPCTDAALLHPIERILTIILGDTDASKRILHRRYALGTTLRHSFCTYLLATLLLPEDSGGLTLPEGIGPELVSLDRKGRVSERLLGQGRLGQSAVHAVSTLMGHAHISRLLKRYAHLLDWSLSAYLHRRSAQIALQPAVLQALVTPPPTSENIRKRTQRRLAAEDQAAASAMRTEQNSRFLPVTAPARVRRLRGRPRADDHVSGSCFIDHFAECSPITGTAYQPWLPPRVSLPSPHRLDVTEAILVIADRGVALRRIAELLDIPLKTVEGVVERANAVVDLTTQRRSPASQASLREESLQPELRAGGWLRLGQHVPLDIEIAAKEGRIDKSARLRAALMRVIRRPRNVYPFRKQERAQAFVDALRTIGVLPHQIKMSKGSGRAGTWFPRTGAPQVRTKVHLTLDSATRFGLALLVASSDRISANALRATRRKRGGDQEAGPFFLRAA
ncbi:site-specific integrase [Sphingomonas sp. ID1715]|uniref:site-specific integrase n=1 Tax=Sphingomonas sp. ID1715 TaxID=1656898 RepID=UPI001487F153|nr:site-specific integrase [Sphingomonas sp. ID1715]NNM78612.1 site-specific integrase [Sphingomonas sp. ID1715]